MNKQLESKRIYTQEYIDSLNLKLELDEFDKQDAYGILTKPKIAFVAFSSLVLICPSLTILIEYLYEVLTALSYKPGFGKWIILTGSISDCLGLIMVITTWVMPVTITLITLFLINLYNDRNEEREKIKAKPQNEKTKNYSGLTSIEKIEKIEEIIVKSHKKRRQTILN